MGLVNNRGANGKGPLPLGGIADRTIDLTPKVLELFHTQGMSMIGISRELKMSQDTVRRILNENSKEGAKSAMVVINRHLPRIAEMLCKKIVDKGDVPHGIELLEKAGVFPQSQTPQQFNDPRLMIAIQNLLPAQSQHPSIKLTKVEQMTIDAEAENAPSTT